MRRDLGARRRHLAAAPRDVGLAPRELAHGFRGPRLIGGSLDPSERKPFEFAVEQVRHDMVDRVAPRGRRVVLVGRRRHENQ
ncbi:hypothetical protein [Microcella sp.]|uniref:hypothetical protein n=1 Tax=Microcella sp. TaxID=1913979 RepID=UPI003F728614